MAAYYQLRIRTNYQSPTHSFGDTERYWLTTADTTLGYQYALQICQYRCLWLAPGPAILNPVTKVFEAFGRGPTIAYASISRFGRPADTVRIDTTRANCFPNTIPQQGAATLPPNDRCSAIEYSFRTPGGRRAARLFRFISDSWEQDIRATPGFTAPAMSWPGAFVVPTLQYSPNLDPNGQPYLNVGAMGTTLPALQNAFLNVLQQTTGASFNQHASPLPASNSVEQWGSPNANAGAPIVYRGFSSHRTGRPYGDYRGRARKSY